MASGDYLITGCLSGVGAGGTTDRYQTGPRRAFLLLQLVLLPWRPELWLDARVQEEKRTRSRINETLFVLVGTSF